MKRTFHPGVGNISPSLMLALGFASMAASLSTDLYLPSYPDLAQHFAVTPSIVQLTLTAFLAGAAIGQLVVGSLSDALGRRPTLLVALAIFAACAVTAAFSVSIEMLIAVRFVQGVAGSAGAVLARAIIADLATPVETAKAYGTLFVLIAMGPAVASPLGAWLTELGGWRAPLAGLSVLGALMFIVALLKVPESLLVTHRQAFHAGRLAKNLWRLTLTPSFLGFSLAFGLGYTGFMVYISSSSFIAQSVFGLTPVGYSLTFALSSLSFMAGAWASSRIVAKLGSPDTLRVGQVLQIAAAALGLALITLGWLALAPYLVMIVCFCFGTGIIMSTASALAISQAVGIAGAGSALVGFSQFVFGALGTPLGGIFGPDTAVPMFSGMAGFAILSLVAAGVSRRSLAKLQPSG